LRKLAALLVSAALAVGSLVAPAASAKAASSLGIAIGTFNMYGCNHGLNYQTRVQKVAKMIAETMRYDIVGMQEYGMSKCRNNSYDVVNILNANYGGNWGSSTLTNYYGLNDTTIIYRKDVVTPQAEWVLDMDLQKWVTTDICKIKGVGGECGNHNQAETGDAWADASRYVRYMRFADTVGNQFVVANLHNIPGSKANIRAHRDADVQRLANLLGQAEPTLIPGVYEYFQDAFPASVQYPMFLTGDYSAFTSQSTMNPLLNMGFYYAHQNAATSINASLNTYSGSAQDSPVDMIMVRGWSGPTFYENYYGCWGSSYSDTGCGSDHRPVKAIFTGLGKNYNEMPKGAVNVTGHAKVGSTLTSKTSGWLDGAKLSYQWYRNGLPISGQVKRKYVLTTADAGAKITAIVKASASGYFDNASASNTRNIEKLKFTKTPKPTISGKAKVGKKLKVKTGTWSPTPAAFKYQWYANGKAIKGATGSSYKIAKKYKGKAISVKVTATKTGYKNASKTSARTAKVKS
jgi:exonuclease III